MQNVNEIDELIKIISKLPGLGPKSAKRIVLKLINNKDELVKPMANVLAQIYKNVTRCNLCGSLKSNSKGCMNCENTKDKFNKLFNHNEKDKFIIPIEDALDHLPKIHLTSELDILYWRTGRQIEFKETNLIKNVYQSEQNKFLVFDDKYQLLGIGIYAGKDFDLLLPKLVLNAK